MKRSKEKVTLKWSKSQKDWVARYPEWKNRNGKITGNTFFLMIQKFEEFMTRDWAGQRLDNNFINFRDYLESGGFDPDTFTISVNAKLKE